MTHRAGRLLTRIDRAGGGLPADLSLYAMSAAFALVTAVTSTLPPHRAWGAIAWWAYAGAALVATIQLLLRRRARPGPQPPSATRGRPSRLAIAERPAPAAATGSTLPPAYGGESLTGTGARAALTWLNWVAACLVPLIVQAAQRAGGRTDRAQEEVLVVERMGARLLQAGTPYLGPDAITALPPAERLGAYSPYQPGMAVFGIPRAVFGNLWWTDARVWFAVVTAGALVAAVSMVRRSGLRVRGIQAVTVLPICALTLATGGDDLPVLALCLLALALAAADRFGWAGAAVGAAAAAKLFAFPVLAVLAVLAFAAGRGRRFLPLAIGLPVVVLIPTFLVDAGAFVENVIHFPLGHGVVQSPAQSPFPGYLLASSVPGGRYLAAGLLVAVAAAITVRLVHRPPRTATAAATISGYGLLAAILLMPTTRFGYLLYPAALLTWSPALRKSTALTAAPDEMARYRR